jgi:hypothetical protein
MWPSRPAHSVRHGRVGDAVTALVTGAAAWSVAAHRGMRRVDRASEGHSACPGQGGGGGHAPERWVDGEGGT